VESWVIIGHLCPPLITLVADGGFARSVVISPLRLAGALFPGQMGTPVTSVRRCRGPWWTGAVTVRASGEGHFGQEEQPGVKRLEGGDDERGG